MLDSVSTRFASLATPAIVDIPLTSLAVGTFARVVAVAAATGAPAPEVSRRLSELGFLPGEQVRIVARGMFSKSPLAVRVGTSTFALRNFEAACIRVRPEQFAHP